MAMVRSTVMTQTVLPLQNATNLLMETPMAMGNDDVDCDPYNPYANPGLRSRQQRR